MKSLNALKSLHGQIVERILSPTATLQEIAGLIGADAKLTQKILKLANSTYYAIPGGVSELSKALQYLDAQTVALVILTSGL